MFSLNCFVIFLRKFCNLLISCERRLWKENYCNFYAAGSGDGDPGHCQWSIIGIDWLDIYFAHVQSHDVRHHDKGHSIFVEKWTLTEIVLVASVTKQWLWGGQIHFSTSDSSGELGDQSDSPEEEKHCTVLGLDVLNWHQKCRNSRSQAHFGSWGRDCGVMGFGHLLRVCHVRVIELY